MKLRKRRNRSQVSNNRRRITHRPRPSQITAKASEWIEHLDDVNPQSPLFLIIRESSTDQELNGNHVPQLKFAYSWADVSGFEVVGHDVFTVSASKGLFEHELWLMKVAQIALEKSAVLVAESVDRFVRHRLYHPTKNRDVLPTVADMMHLKFLTFGVRLATILHPDTPPADVRKHQKWRGQEYKGNGGRPRKRENDKARWYRLCRQVAEMLDKKMTLRPIAKLTGLSHQAVADYRDRMQRNVKAGLDRFTWPGNKH